MLSTRHSEPAAAHNGAMGRLFDRDNAQRVVDELRPAVYELAGLARAMRRAAPEAAKLERAARFQIVDAESMAHALRVARFHELSEAISASGAQLKDAEGGLLDFPALRDGREVLLCWRLGEARVAFWHELESGFRGRRPLED